MGYFLKEIFWVSLGLALLILLSGCIDAAASNKIIFLPSFDDFNVSSDLNGVIDLNVLRDLNVGRNTKTLDLNVDRNVLTNLVMENSLIFYQDENNFVSNVPSTGSGFTFIDNTGTNRVPPDFRMRLIDGNTSNTQTLWGISGATSATTMVVASTGGLTSCFGSGKFSFANNITCNSADPRFALIENPSAVQSFSAGSTQALRFISGSSPTGSVRGIQFSADGSNVANDNSIIFTKTWADNVSGDENDTFQFVHNNATVKGRRKLFSLIVGANDKNFWIDGNFNLGINGRIDSNKSGSFKLDLNILRDINVGGQAYFIDGNARDWNFHDVKTSQDAIIGRIIRFPSREIIITQNINPTTTTGDDTIIIGANAVTSAITPATLSVVIGAGANDAGDIANIVIGSSANSGVGGTENIVIGSNATISDTKINSIAIGRSAINQQSNTISIGNVAQARAPSSIAIGDGAIVFANSTNSIAIGTSATVPANLSNLIKIGTSDYTFSFDGNFDMNTAGRTISFPKSGGTNQCAGLTTLVLGSKTITTSCADVNYMVLAIPQNQAGTIGSINITSKVAGSFNLTSSSALDTSDVYWEIRKIRS